MKGLISEITFDAIVENYQGNYHDGVLEIGCYTHSIEYWELAGEKIAQDYGISSSEIKKGMKTLKEIKKSVKALEPHFAPVDGTFSDGFSLVEVDNVDFSLVIERVELEELAINGSGCSGFTTNKKYVLYYNIVDETWAIVTNKEYESLPKDIEGLASILSPTCFSQQGVDFVFTKEPKDISAVYEF